MRANLFPGKPQTLIHILNQQLPLLFPTAKTESDPYALAVPLVLGVEVPPETEIGWLAVCLCGGDGWVRIGVGLRGL
jgi:autophagy-related protein 5